MKTNEKRTNYVAKQLPLQELTVNKEVALLTFLMEKRVKKSRNAVKSLLAHKQVVVNNRVVSQHDFLLYPGDKITIRRNDHTNDRKQLKGIQIVFEDDFFIVVDKQPGVLSVATDRERQETVYSILNAYLREKNKEARVFVLHRLDREASGLMLFAKSQQVQNIMQERWNELVPKRTFQAVIEGHLPAKGTITSWLTENKNFKVFSSSRENGGMKSVTHFSTLQHGTRYSLVEFELETARKNQIRAQLEELKKPIVGDKKYGATRNPIKRMCLHANELVLNHPFTDLQHRFRSPLPDRMQAMVMPAPDAEKTRQ